MNLLSNQRLGYLNLYRTVSITCTLYCSLYIPFLFQYDWFLSFFSCWIFVCEIGYHYYSKSTISLTKRNFENFYENLYRCEMSLQKNVIMTKGYQCVWYFQIILPVLNKMFYCYFCMNEKISFCLFMICMRQHRSEWSRVRIKTHKT